MWLFLIFVAVPLIEIGLFIQVGGLIGLWPTLAIVLLTAVLGTMLLREQGMAALRDLQNRIAAGRDPTSALAHGAMILVAGVLLLTPGFFTDTIGFLLLIRPVRAMAIAWMARRVTTVNVHTTRSGTYRPNPDRGPRTVEGEYEDVTPGEGPQNEPRQSGGRPSGWSRPPVDDDR